MACVKCVCVVVLRSSCLSIVFVSRAAPCSTLERSAVPDFTENPEILKNENTHFLKRGGITLTNEFKQRGELNQ